MSGDLAAFLAARLDEDEQVARRAASESPWCVSGTNDDGTRNVEPAGAPDGLWHGDVAGHIASSDAAHIARHDPSRVLREVEAGRVLLAEYERSVRMVGESLSGSLRRVVLARAAVYSGHPGYRPDWKP